MRAFSLLSILILLMVNCGPPSGQEIATKYPSSTQVTTQPSSSPPEQVSSTESAKPPTPSIVPTVESGRQANGDSADPSISADGHLVAFSSDASNLVAGDTNNQEDIFVHDRATGKTEQVSVASDGTPGNGASSTPALSADGRYVAFVSLASNLVAGETNGESDIFVHDRVTGKTEQVSVASDGAPGNGRSLYPRISADGRYVVFASLSTNLVVGDSNGVADIFVHDRQTRKTERVSVSSDRRQADSWAYATDISADGSYVAFSSDARNLAAVDLKGLCNVFVHDRRTGKTELTSIDQTGLPLGGGSPVVSQNGRWIAFWNGSVYVRDRQLAQTREIAAETLKDIHGSICGPGTVSLSADGHWIAFASEQPSDRVLDVFVYNLETGQTERITHGNNMSNTPTISADGRWVAFRSHASNLVAGDTEQCSNDGQPYNCSDIFVYDRQTGKTERVSVPGSR